MRSLLGLAAIGLTGTMVLMSVVLAQGKSRKISKGVWGSQDINVTVEDDSATIMYGCADGKINGPLNLDNKGRFKLRGTHTAGHGGPIRMGENNTRPALYTGSVKGKTMTLTVVLTDTNETIGTFTLTLGKPGRIVRCL